MELIGSLILAGIVGLAGWIYTISNRVTKNETRIEALIEAYKEVERKIEVDRGEASSLKAITASIDSKIDIKISAATTDLKNLIHELGLTLKEFTTVVGVLKDELKEIKKNK